VNQVLPQPQVSHPVQCNRSAQNMYLTSSNNFSSEQPVNGNVNLSVQGNYLPVVEQTYPERPQQFEIRHPEVQQVQLVSEVQLEKPIQHNIKSNIIDSQPPFNTIRNEPYIVDNVQNIQQWELPNATSIIQPHHQTPKYTEHQIPAHQLGKSFIDQPSRRDRTTHNSLRYEPAPTKREVAQDRITPIYGDRETKSRWSSVPYEERRPRASSSSVPYEERQPQAPPSPQSNDHIVRPRGYRLEAKPRSGESIDPSHDNTILTRPANNPQSNPWSNDGYHRGRDLQKGSQAKETSPDKKPSVTARQERETSYNPNPAKNELYRPRPRGIVSEVQPEEEYKGIAPRQQQEVKVDIFEPIDERQNRQHGDDNYYSVGRPRHEPKPRRAARGSCCGRKRRRKSRRRSQPVRTNRDN